MTLSLTSWPLPGSSWHPQVSLLHRHSTHLQGKTVMTLTARQSSSLVAGLGLVQVQVQQLCCGPIRRGRCLRNTSGRSTLCRRWWLLLLLLTWQQGQLLTC